MIQNVWLLFENCIGNLVKNASFQKSLYLAVLDFFLKFLRHLRSMVQDAGLWKHVLEQLQVGLVKTV